MLQHDQEFAVLVGGFSGLLMLLALVHHFAKRGPLLPELWLLLAGLVYGINRRWLDWLPDFSLSPDLVISVLLPVLIFANARSIAPRNLVAESVPIGLLALVGVTMTLLIIGFPLAWGMGIRPIDGLFLAAAIAGTDPSAVTSILSRFKVPARLAGIVEGESLFNDGIFVVVFATIAGIALADQAFTFSLALGDLVWAIGAAALLGLALGWFVGKLVVFWCAKNRFVGISMTLALALGSFSLAENGLHVSGVITVMFAVWMFVYVRGTDPHSQGEEFYIGFWEYLNQLVTGLLYFGLGVTTGTHEFFFSWAIPFVVLLFLLARALLVYGVARVLRPTRWNLPLSWQHVLMLGGLRGALSAALVLLVPESYPYRTEILCLVLVVCLFSLLVHPLVLQGYLRKHPVRER